MKFAVAESEQIGRKAEYLTGYSLSLIRRRNLLKALTERCERLVKKLDAKLRPRIELEIGKESKLVVLVKSTAVELTQTKKPRPQYKEICEIALAPGQLQAFLNKVDKDGDKLYVTESTSFGAKIIGRAESIAELLTSI